MFGHTGKQIIPDGLPAPRLGDGLGVVLSLQRDALWVTVERERVMSVKTTLAAIKALGMSARHVDGEYRVSMPIATLGQCWPSYSRALLVEAAENGAYYTNDADDAIGTAKAMLAAWEAY